MKVTNAMSFYFKQICLSAALLALAGSFTGCRSTVTELPPVEIAKTLTTAEQKLGRELLIAFINGDAEGFVKRLSPETQDKFGVKEFKATRSELIKTLGNPVSFRYLTTLEFIAVQPHIWKIRFEHKNRKGELISNEALFRVITGRASDGTILIIGFNFL